MKEDWRDLKWSSDQLKIIEDIDRQIQEAYSSSQIASLTIGDTLSLLKERLSIPEMGEAMKMKITAKRFLLAHYLDREIKDFQEFFEYILEYMKS